MTHRLGAHEGQRFGVVLDKGRGEETEILTDHGRTGRAAVRSMQPPLSDRRDTLLAVPALAFTLLLRLPDRHQPPLSGNEAWLDWRYAASLVPQSRYGDPSDDPPYKRYPGTRHYFASQVQETLFPTRATPGESGRWLRKPADWSVALGSESVPEHELAVDLLEVVRVRLRPHVTFGIIHLSLRGEATADEMLDCSRMLATRYRPSPIEKPLVATVMGSGQSVLHGNDPLRALAAALFGAAHESVALRAYLFAAAQVPADVADEDLAAWRRALGQGHPLDRAREAVARNPERDERRTERFGRSAATFFGRSAALTFREDTTGSLRNVRSYWSETVLFALIQHAYIEDYARRLSELGGSPLSRDVDELSIEWLAFRNVLWWQHPSFTTDIPNKLLRHSHRGLETGALYAELASSFSTYVEARRHRADESEAKALRALQIYGAGFAVVGTSASVMQVAGEEYLRSPAAVAGAVLGLIVVGMTAILVATFWLARRDRLADRQPTSRSSLS